MATLKNIVIVFCILIIEGAASAGDHNNLEDGLPTELTDAYPTAYLNREIQGIIRYDSTNDDENRFVLQPRLEYGFARNWQASIDVPVYAGNADRTGSGDVRLEALHNFNTESKLLPAFALSGLVEFPSGKDSAGIDTAIKLIASKMIVPGTLFHRVHFNAVWRRNAGASEDERENRYALIAGFDVRAGKDAILVMDFVREQDRNHGENVNILDLGVRRQITPFTVISLGAGVGIGDESPDYRLAAGFQYSF